MLADKLHYLRLDREGLTFEAISLFAVSGTLIERRESIDEPVSGVDPRFAGGVRRELLPREILYPDNAVSRSPKYVVQ